MTDEEPIGKRFSREAEALWRSMAPPPGARFVGAIVHSTENHWVAHCGHEQESTIVLDLANVIAGMADNRVKTPDEKEP